MGACSSTAQDSVMLVVAELRTYVVQNLLRKSLDAED